MKYWATRVFDKRHQNLDADGDPVGRTYWGMGTDHLAMLWKHKRDDVQMLPPRGVQVGDPVAFYVGDAGDLATGKVLAIREDQQALVVEVDPETRLLLDAGRGPGQLHGGETEINAGQLLAIGERGK